MWKVMEEKLAFAFLRKVVENIIFFLMIYILYRNE
jgi:hypothetical protein